MIRKLSSNTLAVVLTISILSIVCAAQSQTLTRHVRDVVSSGVAPSVGRLPANQVMHVGLVLALRHAPELENFLQDAYDPTSIHYRQFLTPQQFAARFGASKEDYDAVVRFAKANGFQIIGGSFEGRDVQIKGTVSSIEKAFHVTMGLYQHPTENRTFFSADREPSLNLSFPLWHIGGLDNYSRPRTNLTHKDGQPGPQISGSCPGNRYCASDMRAAYYGGSALTGTNQNIGLLELAGTTLSDLTLYYNNVHQTQPYTPTLVSTGGYATTCTGGCDDAEQNLDMTQAMGMAPGSKMLYNYVCGDAFNSGSFDETACMAAMVSNKLAPLSLQISSSWSWSPADPQTDDPYFQQMASQGQSYFAAAGDSAAWKINNFPYEGEDAWVICVGGTDLITNGAGGPWQSETAWSSSGGGISPDHIAIPSWQQLSGVINSQNKGSTTFRNGPDVSAESNFDFYVCHKGACQGGYGGTSFAAPMWAGYLALVNQQAASKGVSPAGFINPAIYPLGLSGGYAAAFHDITSGSNGFPAVAGYDLVTGWGSPNGQGLIDALTQGGGGGPAISFTPASLKFGKLAVGSTSGNKKVTVTNSGSATLNITSIAISGDFHLATVKQTKKITPCVNGSAVAPGASCLIKVNFKPTQVGTRTGNVTFTDNAPNSPQNVPLTGTGK